ncbi:asparagine synthase-related protein [Fusicatenibacter sp.]
MKQLCGIFDLQTNQYCNKSKDIRKYANEECEVYFYGKVKLDQNDIDEVLILDSYKKYGDTLTEHITGIYILIVYDKTEKKLQVFQDRTTSSLTLYYTLHNNKVYLGTSLKWLLRESEIERKFNDKVLEEFFVNGFIYGKETLMKNVYKIRAFTSLVIRENKVEEIPVKYFMNYMSKGEAIDKWDATLSNIVNQCLADKSEINIPLSSGYDSNYIAYIASTKCKRPINAYSVGGKFGKNEVPVVEENVSAYDNMKLNTSLTDEFTLSNFPDIVWRLEGAVYEVGIFLQYELAKLVFESKKNSLICGECADQVMNQYYLDEERIFIPEEKGTPVYYEFSEYPYIFGSYLILKKNGIISNSFGIETEYPYLDEEFVSIAYSLKNINEKDKRIHKAICQEHLPDIVLKNIAKIGGSTDFHSLFAGKDEISRFLSQVEKSDFYQKYIHMIKKLSYVEKERQTGIKKFKTKIRNVILDTCHINEAERKQSAYYFEEIKLKEYMCCVYLMLFDKLFISGEYDDRLDCEGIDINLNDIIYH